MGRIAELVCHRCGARSYSPLPMHRTAATPACEACGGRQQVVRVMHDRRREDLEVAVDRRRED